MSEREDAGEAREERMVDGASCKEPPKSWWREYEGCHIAVQLRPGVEYIGVTYPNNFLVNESGQVVAVPFLRGRLKVREQMDGSVWIIIQTDDPDPNKPGVKVDIAMPTNAVVFASVLERSLVSG